MAGTTTNIVVYTSDAGKKYPVRISDKSEAVQSPAPATTGFDDSNVKVSVSHHGQKRRTGIQSRGVVIGLPAVDSEAKYSKQTFVPICAKAQYDAFVKNADITYDGGTWKILDKVAEV